MRRTGWLMPQIASHSNLAIALHKATLGARKTNEVTLFHAETDQNLSALVNELMSLEWRPIPYYRFMVYDPKQRVIHAAPFRDRVVHHALMNVAGPCFERGAIQSSYACRTGRGNRAAVQQAATWTHRFPCFLKLDIRRYFDSIPHESLIGLLHRRFKDPQFLTLLERIVKSFQVTPGRGIPIGTLTSQYFANFYLDGLDHWIREGLRCSHSVRYMDDIVLWHSNLRVLNDWLERIIFWLENERGLRLKADPKPQNSCDGLPFLGYRILPKGVLLSRVSRRRFVRRLKESEGEFLEGCISESMLQRRVDSLLAFTDVAECQAWRRICIVHLENKNLDVTLDPGKLNSE